MESLSRLYCVDDKSDVYFYCSSAGIFSSVDDFPMYAKDLLQAALGNLSRVKFIHDNTRFLNIVVPKPGFVIRSQISSEFRGLLKRIGFKLKDSFADDYFNALEQYRGECIWLSRSKQSTGIVIGEEDLEDHLANGGMNVVYPEYLSLVQQIALFESASAVAGFTGSSFHPALLAEDVFGKVIHFSRWADQNSNFEICLPSDIYNSSFWNSWVEGAGKGARQDSVHDFTFIINTLIDQKALLSKNEIIFDIANYKNRLAEMATIKALDILKKKSNFWAESPDVLRDVALFLEHINDIQNALCLMQIAHVKRPKGSFIKKKIQKYRKDLE